MLNGLAYAAFGWLAFTGVVHFAIDVLSQYARGVRAPSSETTLYYGLHSSFALGQVVLGAVGLILIRRAPEVLRSVPVLSVALLASVAWVAIAFLFIEYVPPKFNAVVTLVLLVSFAVMSQLGRVEG